MTTNLDNINTGFVALKGRFFAEDANVSGLFFVIFDNSQKSLYRATLVANRNANTYDKPYELPWAEFEDIIIQMRWTGDQEPTLTTDLKGYLENRLMADIGSEFYAMVLNEDLEGIKEELMRTFYKPLNDMRQKIDIALETIYQSEMDEFELKKAEMEKQDKEDREDPLFDLDIKLPPGSIKITGEFVLSPTQGVPIHNLMVGHQILVKLNPQDSAAQAIFNRLVVGQGTDMKTGLRDAQGNLSVPAEVFQIIPMDDNVYFILAHLTDNVYVEVIEQEQVNIRIYDPEVDKIRIDIEKIEKKADSVALTRARSANLGMFLGLLGVSMGAILLILILIASGAL